MQKVLDPAKDKNYCIDCRFAKVKSPMGKYLIPIQDTISEAVCYNEKFRDSIGLYRKCQDIRDHWHCHQFEPITDKDRENNWREVFDKCQAGLSK